MKTFAAVLKVVGGLTFVVGFLTVINTAFNLSLRFKGLDVPHDYGAAVMFFIIGVVFGAIGFLMDRKK